MKLDLKKAYLLLGSNLGDRKRNLQQAIEKIGQSTGEIIAVSAIYETEPWGKTDQPGFLNQAVALETSLTAQNLLKELLFIEKELGRVRLEKWGQRLIDIDIIFYGDEVINADASLIVPHPLMHERKFVLVPLNEIAAHVIHPIFGEKVSSILLNLNDSLLVTKI